MDSLLREILASRVYEVVNETALDVAPRLSRRLDNHVLLKREDTQPIFSFKIRGAYNKIARLTPEERSRGVIAASAGNHAQGVAFSARRLGIRADLSPQDVLVFTRDGPESGLALIDAIFARGELTEYHLAHSARADLCRRLGRSDEARLSYERAMALTQQDPERRFLEKRLRELDEKKVEGVVEFRKSQSTRS